MLMRMLVDGYLSRTAGMGSNGVDEVKWLKPVFAGETLKATMTVLARRVSSRKPDMGILTMRADVAERAWRAQDGNDRRQSREGAASMMGLHFDEVEVGPRR